ncbi:MAG: xanthine dehydrogenase family protein subunit M [bacterium]|nr:xanthine dehydrogenase family protein subunit M [bacterium]
MTMVHRFDYRRPGSVEDALQLLCQCKDAVVLAGGTDLVPNLKDGEITPGTVIDIKNIKELEGIRFKDNQLSIGALVTFTQLMDSDIINEHFPVIAETAKKVASVGIRNRATMAGNICSAVPCLDSGPLLRAYDAKMIVKGCDGERTLTPDQWFKDARITGLKHGEILTEIIIPAPGKHGGSFVKLMRYRGEDLAQASVFTLCLPDNQYRVSFGSVAPVPLRSHKIEALLEGKELSDELLEKAKDLVSGEISPITDIRASKEYRMHMCRVMLGRSLKAASQRLHGNGPAYDADLI